MTGVINVVEGTAPMGAGDPEVLEERAKVMINNMGLFSFIQDDITARVGTVIVARARLSY